MEKQEKDNKVLIHRYHKFKCNKINNHRHSKIKLFKYKSLIIYQSKTNNKVNLNNQIKLHKNKDIITNTNPFLKLLNNLNPSNIFLRNILVLFIKRIRMYKS